MICSFRNFKRPMAVQDKKNEQHYINNYNVRVIYFFFNILFLLNIFLFYLLSYSILSKPYQKV